MKIGNIRMVSGCENVTGMCVLYSFLPYLKDMMSNTVSWGK